MQVHIDFPKRVRRLQANVYMPYVSDPDFVMQPNFLEIMALSGAECLSRTRIEPWILGT